MVVWIKIHGKNSRSNSKKKLSLALARHVSKGYSRKDLFSMQLLALMCCKFRSPTIINNRHITNIETALYSPKSVEPFLASILPLMILIKEYTNNSGAIITPMSINSN